MYKQYTVILFLENGFNQAQKYQAAQVTLTVKMRVKSGGE